MTVAFGASLMTSGISPEWSGSVWLTFGKTSVSVGFIQGGGGGGWKASKSSYNGGVEEGGGDGRGEDSR